MSMMSKDGDFSQSKPNRDSFQTEIGHLPAENYSTNTQLSNKKLRGTKHKRVLMWLIVASPEEHRGTVLPVSKDALIGRQGDIRWHDARMSRRHAQFVMLPDPNNSSRELFALQPVQDRNGTLVNGKRITSATPLHENDVLIMGDTRFVVKVLE